MFMAATVNLCNLIPYSISPALIPDSETLEIWESLLLNSVMSNRLISLESVSRTGVRTICSMHGWIIVAVISLVLAGVLFAAEQVFLGLVSFGILVYFLKKVLESDFRQVIKRLRKGSPDYRSNPFE